MRALFYSGHPDITSMGTAGYATHIRGMIGGLQANGVHVNTVVAGDRRAAAAAATSSTTYESDPARDRVRAATPRLAWNMLRDARLVALGRRCSSDAAKRLKDGEFDFIYERHSHLQRDGVRLARRFGIPHVLEVNSPPAERANFGGRSPLDRYGSLAARRAVVSADIVAFVSAALMESYSELVGEPIRNGIVVPNAVERSLLQVVRPRTKHNGQRNITVGFVGSLMDWHGLGTLINAFALIYRQRPHARLEIVGDGKLRPSLEREAEREQLGDAVLFTGAIPHAEALRRVAEFDIGVMVKSNWYGSPVKLFEYAALGAAIVAPDVAPVREVFQPDREVLLVGEDLGEVVETLTRLVDSSERRKELARAAKARVAQDHTWDRAAQRVLQSMERKLAGA